MLDFLKRNLWAWAILVTATAGLLVLFVNITPEQKAGVITFAGVLSGLLTRAGQKQIPPGHELVEGAPTSIRRISMIPKDGGASAIVFAGAVLLALGAGLGLAFISGCSSAALQAAEAKALPTLTQGQAVAALVLRAVDVAQSHGVTPESIASTRAALDKGDVGEALVLARGALQSAADLGADVPPELLAGLELAIRIREAQGVEAFAHWSAVPSPVKADGGT
jgi:hypothetical protein